MLGSKLNRTPAAWAPPDHVTPCSTPSEVTASEPQGWYPSVFDPTSEVPD